MGSLISRSAENVGTQIGEKVQKAQDNMMVTQMSRQLAMQNEMREKQMSMQLAMARRGFMVRFCRFFTNGNFQYYAIFVTPILCLLPIAAIKKRDPRLFGQR